MGDSFIQPIEPDGLNIMGGPMVNADIATAGDEEKPPTTSATEFHSKTSVAIAIGIGL